MAPTDGNRAHAVVLGGSMAGLLAARVLADHFGRVTIVDRDVMPRGASQRRGAPQGRHTHAIIAGGCEAAEQLLPGLLRALGEAGGVPADPVRDLRWFFEGGHLARCDSEMHGVMVSRPRLEAAVRERVRALPQVTLRDNTPAVALLADAAGRVTGVQLAAGDALEADLVVDATGRGSRSPQWLRELGYETPVEEQVQIGVGYTTRLFRRKPEHLAGDVAAIVPPTPDGKRGGVMLAQEGERWTVTLVSHFVQPAGEPLEAFIDFAAHLPSHDIYEVIRTAEPLGDAFHSRFPVSLRRRYERLKRFPEGFVVLGDALCSFNPIYGQGMSVAAQEALALGATLRDGRDRVGLRFFRKAAGIVDNPWITASGNDLRMPEAVGPRGPALRLVNAYMTRLHRAAHHDAALSLAFLRVANLTAPPASLFAPHLVARVVRGMLMPPRWSAELAHLDRQGGRLRELASPGESRVAVGGTHHR